MVRGVARLLVVFIGRRTRLRIAVAAGVFATVLVLRATMLVTGLALPAAARLLPIRRVETTQPVVALTFEVARGTTNLRGVLEVLARHELRATFFLNGDWVVEHPELARALRAAGHEVGQGGQWAEKLPALSHARIADSITTAHQTIREVTGAEPAPLFRPPGGYCNAAVIEVALDEGYHTVIWSLDSRDTSTRDPGRVGSRVGSRARPGDIIRFSADDTGHQAAAGLEAAIAELRARGFTMTTVGNLLRSEVH